MAFSHNVRYARCAKKMDDGWLVVPRNKVSH
jgi:hypothetical protein